MKFPVVLLGIAYAVGSAAPGAAAPAASAGLRGGGRSLEARLLEGAVAGTYLFADVQYEGTPTGPTEIDSIETEDGIYTLTNGPPGWSKAFESGTSKMQLPPGLAKKADDTIDLQGQRPIKAMGAPPNLFGRNLRGEDEEAAARTPEQERNLAELRRNLKEGTRTVLAVKIIVGDGEYAFTEDVLRDEVFGQDANGNPANDQVNLRTQYAACSHNKLNFEPVGDRTISGNAAGNLSTNISNGVVTVHLPGSTVSQGDGTIRNAVNSELANMFGQSASSLATHVMHCMPQAAMSGIAYAYVNSWNSVYKNNWCNYPSGQMHEIGHNIGLAHSNEAGTYKDQTGFMGYSYSNDEQKMCFNNAKTYQLGWFSDQQLILPAGSDWSGTITSHINYGDGSGNPVLIRLGDASPYQFIGFNWKTGYNGNTAEAGNLVTIQRYTGSGYSASELLHKLGVDASTTITITDTSDTITVNAIDTTAGTADITINNGGGPTGPGPQESPPSDPPPTTAPTPAPTPAPTNPPTTPFPTSPPTTAPPTLAPTPPPTQAPTTANPTSSPTTAPPTPAPTPQPTDPPTFAPVQKYICAKTGDGLTNTQICDGGSPLDLTCGAGDIGSSTAGCSSPKKCQIATCSSSGPSPTPAPVEQPTGPGPAPSPSTCDPAGFSCGNCCNGCETKGKMSARVCL